MGLSSSQARLLNLTSRMHQIEYKAAKLEAEKLQMANKSAQVYETYLNALDKTKLQYKILTTDGSVTYTDATYTKMLQEGYFIQFKDDIRLYGQNGVFTNDAIGISEQDYDNYVEAAGNIDLFVGLQTGKAVGNPQTNDAGFIEIYTADQLNSALKSTNKCILMADITLPSTWTSKSFRGQLDGNGHTITLADKALFDTISGGSVYNLNLTGNVTTGRGMLANTVSNGTISNVQANGSITSTASTNIGGLIGKASGSSIKIENCTVNVNVNASANGSTYVGGIVGYSNGVTITDCISTGNVTGGIVVGGIAGYMENATATNCSASGNVTSPYASTSANKDVVIGGFVGSTGNNTTISNCSASGNVSAIGRVVGGFVGNAMTGSTISNSNASGDVNSDDLNVAGFVSAINGGKIENCNSSGAVSKTDSSNNSGVGAFFNSNMSGTSGKGEIINCYSSNTSIDFCTVNDPTKNLETYSQATTPNNNIINPSGANTSINTITDGGSNPTYREMFELIQAGKFFIDKGEDTLATGHENDINWFTNMYLAGEIFIYEKHSTKDDYIQTSVSTNTNLQEVTDEINLKKAEAQYEADMLKIDKKDRKYDSDLAALDAERNAVKSEIETLKSVAKENVERTFKLFG